MSPCKKVTWIEGRNPYHIERVDVVDINLARIWHKNMIKNHDVVGIESPHPECTFDSCTCTWFILYSNGIYCMGIEHMRE